LCGLAWFGSVALGWGSGDWGALSLGGKCVLPGWAGPLGGAAGWGWGPVLGRGPEPQTAGAPQGGKGVFFLTALMFLAGAVVGGRHGGRWFWCGGSPW